MVNMNIPYQRPAKSLTTLRDEINAVWTGRQPDLGFITGYRAAENFTSHNPNERGIAMGYDIGTYVTGAINEPDGRALADYLRTSARERLEYLIHDMGTEAQGVRPMIAGNHTGWDWQPYTGISPHSDHIHISIVDLYWGDTCGVPAAVYDSELPWGVLEHFTGKSPAPAPQTSPPSAPARLAPAAFSRTVTDTVAYVRTAPQSDAPLVAHYPEGITCGATLAIKGYTAGQDPYGTGDNAWYVTDGGFYVWANAAENNVSDLPYL